MVAFCASPRALLLNFDAATRTPKRTTRMTSLGTPASLPLAMRNLRDYSIVTATYWGFTLTDGALRMLVLLYLHGLGHAPLEIASLFLFYELFGVVTNFLGGWLGARFGLKSTLFAGLALQIVACSTLALRATDLSIPVVLVAQAISGVAKDLTKMSSKSYIKLVVPPGDERGLMRWVSVLTGSKNALKGVGFFLGGVLLGAVGFAGACALMAALLAFALIASAALLPRAAGKAREKALLRHLFARDARVNWLSAARLFLFGSRDVWFVLALPIFLSVDLEWSHSEVGAFLALWVIGYGIVQAAAPAYAGKRASRSEQAADAQRLGKWTAALLVPLGGLLAGLATGAPPAIVLIIGLTLFGAVFATNSALHSYLIITYADGDQASSLNVGFYYMANAAGRLVGTLLSGAVFQLAGQGRAGLTACIATSVAFVCVSVGSCIPLRAAERRAGSAAVTGLR